MQVKNQSMDFRKFEQEIHGIVREAIDNGDSSLIESKCNEEFGSDLKLILDQVFRDVVLESLSVSDLNITYLQTCIEFCIALCRKSLITSSMPAVLLSDIFDTLILDADEQMFTFVEQNVHVWKEELFFTACKNTLLRMCNNLLRRLSRSQNTVFCGRILLFLAKFFPFSERSGLNIVSEFNIDNVTEFASEPIEIESYRLIDDDEIDEKQLNPDLKIDYNLYKKFWTLQDFFRDPIQCYTKWSMFSNNATDVLLAFDSYKLDLKYQQFNQADGTHYFPKYLTNQKLLELQLSDTNFRRYVLLQFLILFQFLKSNVKFKQDKYDLKVDQSDFIDKMSEKVYKLLESTTLNATEFVESIKIILQREESWSTWKNDGCKEFPKPSNASMMDVDDDKVQIDTDSHQKKRLGDLIKDATSRNQFFLGNTDLTKLWNLQPNNLDACKAKNRDFLPSLDHYLKHDDSKVSDLESVIEDQYRTVNSDGWRALRLMARKNPFFFSSSNPVSSSSSSTNTTNNNSATTSI